LKISKRFDSVLQNLLGGLLLLVVGLTFFQVLLRFFFKGYLAWGEEISRYVMIWMTYIGAIWLSKNGKHLSVGIKLQKNFNRKVIAFIDILINLCLMVVALVITYYGTLFVQSTLNYAATSISWLRMGYIFMPMPIAMAFIAYYSVKNMINNFLILIRKEIKA
jgi:TRAP-type C4-dicarboxylate transport system permease small subunit